MAISNLRVISRHPFLRSPILALLPSENPARRIPFPPSQKSEQRHGERSCDSSAFSHPDLWCISLRPTWRCQKNNEAFGEREEDGSVRSSSHVEDLLKHSCDVLDLFFFCQISSPSVQYGLLRGLSSCLDIWMAPRHILTISERKWEMTISYLLSRITSLVFFNGALERFPFCCQARMILHADDDIPFLPVVRVWYGCHSAPSRL